MIRSGILPKERKNLKKKNSYSISPSIKCRHFLIISHTFPLRPSSPGSLTRRGLGPWENFSPISTDSGSGKFSRVLFPFSTDWDMGNRDPSSCSSPGEDITLYLLRGLPFKILRLPPSVKRQGVA